MKYKQISERNQDLLLMGAKITGTFVEGYYYNEELFYVDEYADMISFATWIDNIIGGAGPANIKQLWLGFMYPENDSFSVACKEIQTRIQEIKSYTS
jgi:hypothetical protein|tara:strand:- start:225 stop:515 length:291 start_codon:yes stop_codon:yes gene_type:complete